MAASSVSAQSIVPPLWFRDSIRSSVLGQTRFLRIALPPDYQSREHLTERYPVLIVFDAEQDLPFASLVADVRAWSAFASATIPRLIIVGVENGRPPARIRDMTPPGLEQAQTGGAPAFLRFLSTELWPRMDAQYRALPVVVVAGHSLTGLFAAWAFGQGSDLIRGAIALSPTVILGGGLAGQRVLEAIGSGTTRGRLFILNGTAEPLDSAVQSFVARLDGRLPSRAAFKYDRVTGATHAQTQLLGMIPGLRYVFQPVSLAGYDDAIARQLGANSPVRDLIAVFDSTRAAYARGAARLGMPGRLPLDFLMHHDSDPGPKMGPLRLHVCQEIATSYPKLWNGFACVGDAEASLGHGTDAATSYRLAADAAKNAGDAAAADSLAGLAEHLSRSHAPRGD